MTRSHHSMQTALRHAGTRHEGAVNPPVVRASTVLFDSLDHLETATAHPFEGFYYGRFGTPTHAALNEALCALSGAAGTVFYPSGLAAIAGVLMSFLRAGDEVLVADCVYGPTRKFCDQQLTGLGIGVRYFPATGGAGIEALIGPDTRLIFCESPGSLGMELQDLPAICALAAARDIAVVVDNTWATPLNCRVLDMGVAVDIQAGTKYLAGHADAMIGMALCAPSVLERVRRVSQAYGYCVSPDDAWLTLRGLRTLDIRLRQHAAQADALITCLREQPEVLQIADPRQPDHPQHDLWVRDFSGGNGLFSVELRALERAELAALVDAFELFGLGYSWGGFESLCLPFTLSGARAAMNSEGGGTWLRFHAGLEDPRDLIADLQRGFEAMRRLA